MLSRRTLFWSGAGLLLAAIAACRQEQPDEPPPPLPVRTVKAAWIDYTPKHALIAQIKPLRQIVLVSRVSGFLTERNFNEGSIVRQGTLLYQVEPCPYQLALQRAQAQLKQAQAANQNAELEFARVQQLKSENIVSMRRFDQARADYLAKSGALSQSEAELAQAELNLTYTQIKAPFTGWIGLTNVDVGNYLSAPSKILTTLSDIEQVRVEFNLSDAYLQGDLLTALTTGTVPDWQISLQFSDGSDYAEKGRICYWDNQVDLRTATLTMQALFANPQHRLLPGLFVQVTLQSKQKQKVLAIDRRAVQVEQGNDFVLLVSEQNQLVYTPIVTGAIIGEKIIVRHGLRPGDELVLAGNPYLRPGEVVEPLPNTSK